MYYADLVSYGYESVMDTISLLYTYIYVAPFRHERAIINSAAAMLNHKVRTAMTTTTIIRSSRMHPHANGQNFAVADRYIRAASDNSTRLLPEHTSR